MPWWVATMKPGNSRPKLHRCRDEDEADDRVDKAQSEGLSAEKYETGTDDIYMAKDRLSNRIAEDFGEESACSNWR